VPPKTSWAGLVRRTQMQFNHTKDLQTPSGEESVKSVHDRREGYGVNDWGKGWIFRQE